MKSGVYLIICSANQKVYVGSSIDIEERLAAHVLLLKRNSHHSPYLQHSWNLYGENSFRMETLEETAPVKEELLAREQFHMDRLKSWLTSHGFNVCKEAKSCLGIQRSEKTKKLLSDQMQGHKRGVGRVFDEVTKKKIGEKMKQRFQDPEQAAKHSERMKKWSAERKAQGLSRTISQAEKDATSIRSKGNTWGTKTKGQKRPEQSQRQIGNTFAKGHKNAQGYQHTEETKRKIAEANRLRYQRERQSSVITD